jgi:serralysin
MANPGTSDFAQGLTGDLVVDVMTSGYKWLLGPDRTVDWSVANGFNGEYWISPSTVQNYVGAALDVFSQYADIKFSGLGFFANPTSAYNAGSDITVSLDATVIGNPNVWAVGFFPATKFNYQYYVGQPGDVYLNVNSQANTLSSYDPGSKGWAVLLHELGHALGLKHPFDDGGTGHPTFSGSGIGELDQDWVTVMSYSDDYNWNQIAWHPATPMVADVIALQYLYGPNQSTNAGDSFYNLTADNLYKTIWDASGTDTVSAQQATSGWTILLPYAQLSSLVPTKAGFAAPSSDMALSSPHSFTWLTGDIENATGSAFSDDIQGNALGNQLFGGAGDDTVWGQDGNDSIVGGAGADDLNGNKGQDTVIGHSTVGESLRGGQGDDVIDGGASSGHDFINGNMGSDTVTGGDGGDTVRGGQGDDLIHAGSGADLIYGDLGANTITGGAGADTFHSGASVARDVITDFHQSEGDRVQVAASLTYTTAQVGGDVEIDVSNGDVIVLQNTQLLSLQSGWIVSA